MKRQVPPPLQRLPSAKQRRMDELLEKNGEGTISLKEKAVLDRLVARAEELMVANGKRLADYAEKVKDPVHSVDAVPVTVWVAPSRVER